MESILIIDTSYLIYRSYFAYPLLSYNGVATGAYYGFTKAVMQMYQELQPTTLVFATDTREKTWRHKEFSGYKATRSAPEPAMIQQIPLILEWCNAISSNVFAYPGYEADDIIGTVSKQYLLNNELAMAQKQTKLIDQIAQLDGDFFPKHSRNPERESLVFSSDRDLYQMFVIEGVKFVRAKTKGGDYELFGYKEFQSQYGLQATQWVDAKALVGDSSDNLPGIPSVGPKTASTILNEVGHLYHIYKALGLDETPFRHEILPGDWDTRAQEFIANPKKAKLITLLKDNYQQVVNTYNLSTLSNVGLVNVNYSSPDFAKGLPLLEKFAFKTLIQTTNALVARSNEPEPLL